MADQVKVLITCSSGLTSTMLATRVNRLAKERGLELLCDSMPTRRAMHELGEFDVVLLSPGAKGFERDFTEHADGAAVAMIPMVSYGRLQADKVVAQTLELLPAERRDVAEGREVTAGQTASTASSSSGMRELIVCCGGGFSSSVLCEKVEEEIERRNLHINVHWRSVVQLENDPVEADCVLIAPQVSPSLERVRENAGDVPVALMDMHDYGTMDARAIVNQALLLMAEHDLSR